jgi:gamma-glutamyl-gamma-aminobutyrate hydrolase PuuD
MKVIVDRGFSSEYKNFFNEFLKDPEYITIKEAFNNESLFDRCNLAVFTGGEDVTPKFYNEANGKYTSCNIVRDNEEFSLFNALSRRIPKVGICRGSQFLTVASGGNLVQHVENHANGNHLIEFTKGSSPLMITSTHHQMMYPYNLRPNKYELIAWSSKHMSNVYLNGNNQQIKVGDKFLEPEIVYYKDTNSLCIQGHPEYPNCPDQTKKVCMNIIKKHLDI